MAATPATEGASAPLFGEEAEGDDEFEASSYEEAEDDDELEEAEDDDGFELFSGDEDESDDESD